MLSTAIEISQAAWSQAQLSLRFGDLGFRAVSYHAPATSFQLLLYLVLANNKHLKNTRFLCSNVEFYSPM